MNVLETSRKLVAISREISRLLKRCPTHASRPMQCAQVVIPLQFTIIHIYHVIQFAIVLSAIIVYSQGIVAVGAVSPRQVRIVKAVF